MFTDSGNGTISDSQTGLMWQQAENADKMDYESAIAFCENLDLAGHDDWRLPTKEELLSLAAAGGDPLHEHFPGLEQERYWALSSSDELSWAESPDRIAYTVDFNPESGNYRQPTTYFRTYEYCVHAVRLGTDEEAILTDEAESGAVVEHAESLRTLTGHTDGVTACAVSPDGTWIVSASDDRTLKVWDAATGAEVRTLVGHEGPVTTCAVSPDGTWIVSGSKDRAIRMWDAATGRPLHVLTRRAEYGTVRQLEEVTACAVSPDGAWIVSGSAGGRLTVWDAATAAELRTITCHTYYVSGCAVSPDGTWIVSAHATGAVQMWNAATGSEIRAFAAHAGGADACAVSPDGAWILSAGSNVGPGMSPMIASSGSLKLWDSATGDELCTIRDKHRIHACAVSADGAWIVSGHGDGTLGLWDATTGAEIRRISGHTRAATALAIGPDGAWLVSGSIVGDLKMWAAGTMPQASRPRHIHLYFEVPVPEGDGVCSDNECPCGDPGAAIPRGSGYLYIAQDVVDFRRDARTALGMKMKVALIQQQTGRFVMFEQNTIAPILMCEQGARRRGLDLDVAAADARHWWETGLVPLRPTPLVDAGSVPPSTGEPAGTGLVSGEMPPPEAEATTAPTSRADVGYRLGHWLGRHRKGG